MAAKKVKEIDPGRPGKASEAAVLPLDIWSPTGPTPKVRSEILVAPPKRNDRAEQERARGNRALRAAEVRLARDSQEMDVMQLAQSLILCGLPYSPTKERQISLRARLGDGTEVRVTFTAALDDVDMPFGSDRTLLHFLLDKAVKTGSRHVSWETAREFLTQMGFTTAGGKDYADLRARFERLRGLAIGVKRHGLGRDSTLVMPFISRSELPSSADVNAEKKDQAVLPLSEFVRYGVEIGEDFYKDLTKFHVPVPTELLIKTRKQAQLQDMCLFLHWRCYAARSESLIPWESIREQFGRADSNPWRLKSRFKSAIEFLATIWPELRAEARSDGLWVAPPRDHVYLLPQGKEARRLS